MIETSLEQPKDAAELETLYDLVFGPGRREKAVYRLRDAAHRESRLCYVAREKGALRGAIRFWRVSIANDRQPARLAKSLLLGPLAVDPEYVGRGIGIGLMEMTLSEAAKLGHKSVALVGDQAYYSRVGFSREQSSELLLPGLEDPRRLLARELAPGAAADMIGEIVQYREV